MNDCCVICGREIMTESGHVCRSCAGGTTTNLLATLAGGALVAAVIIAASTGSEAPGMLQISDSGGVAAVTLQADGLYEICGSHDGVTWTVIESAWDTSSYGRTLLIDHQNTGFALFKARAL